MAKYKVDLADKFEKLLLDYHIPLATFLKLNKAWKELRVVEQQEIIDRVLKERR